MAWRPSSRGIASIQEWAEQRATGDFVVHVWAEWNEYDRTFDQKLRALSEQANIRVLSLNTDERQFWELLRECNVTNVPALLVFHGGAYVQTIQNYDAKVAFSEALGALQSARTSLPDLETRTDAIAFFQSHGVSAWLRDWSMGETVLAATEPSGQRDGITAWRRMVCIAPEGDVWALYDFAVAKEPRLATGTLGDMCQLALQRLLTSAPQSSG